jgi:hypothetical protein
MMMMPQCSVTAARRLIHQPLIGHRPFEAHRASPATDRLEEVPAWRGSREYAKPEG